MRTKTKQIKQITNEFMNKLDSNELKNLYDPDSKEIQNLKSMLINHIKNNNIDSILSQLD